MQRYLIVGAPVGRAEVDAAERLTRPAQGESHTPESWSPKGDRFLFTITKGSVANQKVTGFEAVSVTTQPTFAFGNAVAVAKLFLMAGAALRTPYDIAPDGRVVGHITAGQMEDVRSQNDQTQVVLNWFEDLKA